MSGSITDVFGSWQVARDQLELAVDSFHDACTTLHQFIDQSPGAKSLGSVKDYALEINGQMEIFAAITAKMTQSRAILRKVANTSTTLVPINVLPSEILSRIFMLTVLSYASIVGPVDCRVHPLVVIPAVCTRWRRLAISTRLLWSHVEVYGLHLVRNRIFELGRLQLWLERAYGTALHLDFQRVPKNDHLFSILQPHWARTSSLIFQHLNGNFFQTTLNTFANCSSGPLTTLVVRCIVPHEETNGNAGALHSPWPTTTLHGLVHLELVDLPQRFCPNADGLILVLLNNPSLQTLRLRSVHIASSQDDHLPLINLPHLRVLDLSLGKGSVVQRLPSVLMPGDQELDVRVDMPGPHNHELNASMHALFHRSHVTQFVAWSLLPDCSSQLAGYLDCLPELQALVLDYSMGAYGSLAALVVENEGRIQARQPGLWTLGVLAGKFDSNAQDWLGRIVSTHHLSELRFGFSTRVVAGPNGGRDLEGMLRSIRRQGQFVVHDYYYRGPEDCNFNLQAFWRD